MKKVNRDYPLAPTYFQDDQKKKKKSGATSPAAEKEYAAADSIRNRAKNMTGKQLFEETKKKGPGVLAKEYEKASALEKSADKKTKATGGVVKKYRL